MDINHGNEGHTMHAPIEMSELESTEYVNLMSSNNRETSPVVLKSSCPLIRMQYYLL